jgi:hypothetical protein
MRLARLTTFALTLLTIFATWPALRRSGGQGLSFAPALQL